MELLCGTQDNHDDHTTLENVSRMTQTDWLDFAPRFGVACSPSSKPE
jgi:hypothetical protein